MCNLDVNWSKFNVGKEKLQSQVGVLGSGSDLSASVISIAVDTATTSDSDVQARNGQINGHFNQVNRERVKGGHLAGSSSLFFTFFMAFYSFHYEKLS